MHRSLVFLLAATLATAACATDDTDLGGLDLSLVGQAASGTTYRLRAAVLTIDGPGGPITFHTEDDPDRSQINARLQSGAYTLSLAPGWHLEKLIGGTGQPVEAALLSSHPLGFQVVAGEFTPVVLRFRAGADDVGLGEGDVGVSIGVEEQIDGGVVDAPAPPVEIVASPATLSIPEGASRPIAVHLAHPIATPVTIRAIFGPELAVSPQFLTFTPADHDVDQILLVTSAVDDDAAHESTFVTLTVPGVTAHTVAVTVEDDDALFVDIGSGGLMLVEGSTITSAARLSAQPTQPITVVLTTDNPAVATVSPASMVFTPSNWNVQQTFSITGVHDLDTAAATTMLHLGAVGIPVVTSRPIQVSDDDTVGLVITPPTLTIDEGTAGTAQVRLSFIPPAPVTITATTSDTARVSVSPATLTFDPTSWDVPRTVTVTALADADQQNQTALVRLGNGTVQADIGVTLVDTTVVTTLGWPTSGGSSLTIPGNELQLFRVQLNAPATLQQLQVTGGALLTSGRLALYREVGNGPGQLLFGGGSMQLNGPGQPTVQPVNGVTLPAGGYYLGVVASTTVPIAAPPAPQPSVTRCRVSMPFGGGFPASIPPASCQPAQPLSIAAQITQ